uniref:Uncharacterized protein n=1 Tax=Otus sunia TaxID=257818 RepID=A0A8C8ALN2_9STRI
MAAAGPGAAGAARVSSGRDLSCVPEVAGALGAVQGGGERGGRGSRLERWGSPQKGLWDPQKGLWDPPKRAVGSPGGS